MPIEFPDGPECSVYGYTYSSNCTADDGSTLGYNQKFSVVAFENGNTAWVPLAGVYQGNDGRQGEEGRAGPDAGEGSQGPQGPTGAPGEGADDGSQGFQGNTGRQGSEPDGYNSDTVESDRFTIGLSGEYTVPSLSYSGLETVAPAANRLFQIYVQPGRNDLSDGFTGGFYFGGENQIDSFGQGLTHPTFINAGGTGIAHPTRHVNPDDLMYFSLWRQDLFGPVKWAFYDNLGKSIDDQTGLRTVFGQMSRILFSTPQGYCGGIDTKGITAIADHGDRPVMGRVIEFPFVDLFREFQGANPSNTAGYSGGISQKPLGTLPVAGRPGLVRDNFTDPTQDGALSSVRRWNIKNLGFGRYESSSVDPAGAFTRNPFSYAPLNLLPDGSDDESWATVYGGRMPYMFYFGGPIIAKDGDTDAFDPEERWNSTKGADGKHAIYIQDLYKPGPKSGSTLPSGSSGPWPLRQTMHFNGYKYTDAGATTIDKIVFLTGTASSNNYPCPLGTGGSVTLVFSQNNPGSNTGGPTYGFESVFEFVAGSCADTDPKIDSYNQNVRFAGGSTLSLGSNTGDVDVFHIFCTGLQFEGGETGYLISHQQYKNGGDLS